MLQFNMYFKIIGEIREIELIATGHGVRNLTRLNKIYGKTNWRKLKGNCQVRLPNNTILEAEVHWYEGHGIGKKEMKIKRYIGG